MEDLETGDVDVQMREPTPEPVLPPRHDGRPRRPRKLPKRFQPDEPPPPPAPIEIVAPPLPLPDQDSPAPSDLRAPKPIVRTQPNTLGLYRCYIERPTHNPDDEVTLDDLCDSPGLNVPRTEPSMSSTTPFAPFLNASVARLMCWLYSGSNLKSAAELDRLVRDVLLKEDFRLQDIVGFSAAREQGRLDEGFDIPSTAQDGRNDGSHADNLCPAGDGWRTGSVKLRLPAEGVKCPESDAPEFEVKGILYRPLLDVMKEAFQGPAFLKFHTTPFHHFWDPDPESAVTEKPSFVPSDIPNKFPIAPEGHERIYDEIYSSRAMLEAHQNLPASGPSEPYTETVIAAFMFWSDSTHLANFGTAALWPLYTFFGNLSKYIRGQPTSNSCYHQAYIPSVRAPLLIILGLFMLTCRTTASR